MKSHAAAGARPRYLPSAGLRGPHTATRPLANICSYLYTRVHDPQARGACAAARHFPLQRRPIGELRGGMSSFVIEADYALTGDQPQAVDALAAGVQRGDRFQTLLGVTGSGKTFTMANVIAAVGKPTLVIAHNKTLAAQLCNEFREFLPEQRGRVLRELLRLLSARGVRRRARSLHREGLLHKRRDRPAAARRHLSAVPAPRRRHRRQRELHLRPRFARRIPRQGSAAAGRSADRSR